MYKCEFINKEEVKKFLKSLTVINDKIYITSSKMGEWFTKVYYREVIDFFMHPLNIYVNYELTELLKIALSKSIITIDDFRYNDSFIIEKITNSQCIELIKKLKSIKSNIILIQDDTDYDIHKKLKPRMVDPHIYLNNKIIKTSDLSPEINYLITNAIQKLTNGIYLKKIEYQFSSSILGVKNLNF